MSPAGAAAGAVRLGTVPVLLPDRSFTPARVRRPEAGALQISVARVGAPRGRDAALVSLSGRCEPSSAGTLRDCLASLVDAGIRVVIVDLRRTTALDATGVGVLAGTASRLRQRDGELVIVRRPDGPMARAMRLAGLDRDIPTVDQPRQALPPTPLYPS